MLDLQDAELLFGGRPQANHKVPAIYGCYEPTLIHVPLKHLKNQKKFNLVTKELFGPVSVIVPYKDKDIDQVMGHLEQMD